MIENILGKEGGSGAHSSCKNCTNMDSRGAKKRGRPRTTWRTKILEDMNSADICWYKGPQDKPKTGEAGGTSSRPHVPLSFVHSALSFFVRAFISPQSKNQATLAQTSCHYSHP